MMLSQVEDDWELDGVVGGTSESCMPTENSSDAVGVLRAGISPGK